MHCSKCVSFCGTSYTLDPLLIVPHSLLLAAPLRVGVVICLERGADGLHMVQLMPLPFQNPHHLLPHIDPDWFNLSLTGLPRLSWIRGR